MIPRLPAPDKLLADMRAWVEGEYGPVVRDAAVTSKGPCAELRLELHPAVDAMTITADEQGGVVVSAETAGAGPGYHTFACRILDRLGEVLDIAWSRRPELLPPGSPPAWVGARLPLADRPLVERDHLASLGAAVGRAVALRRRGITGVEIGLRPGTRFASDGTVMTPVGPRGDAWLARAARDLTVAADVLPWWYDVMDARYQLARALVILWTEIRWRPPADDAERATMDEALTLLRKAFPTDPSLAYPYREWAELIALRGLADPIAERVLRRAEQADQAQPPIGYRRRPVTVVHEGWLLPVPGSFSDRRADGEWSGGDRGRHVTFAATVTQLPGGMPMSADRFLTDVAGELGEGTLHHEDGGLRGRARVTSDASSGVEVAVLEGFSAVTGSGCAIRIEFSDSDDWRWAIDLWRSLRPT